jgi:tetratricopeptide (TPR) repeat protein
MLLSLLVTFWVLRKDTSLFFLLFSTIVVLVPVVIKANQFSLGWEYIFIAERYLYLSAAFYSLFVVAVLNRLVKGKVAVVGGITAIGIGVLAPLTLVTTEWWKDDSTITARMLKDCPELSLSRCQKGYELYGHDELGAAMKEFEAALRPNPLFVTNIPDEGPTGNMMFGNKKMRKSKFMELLSDYRSPLLGVVHHGIGLVFLARNDLPNAIRKFRTAATMQPYNEDFRAMLAWTYLRAGEFDKARQQYRLLLTPIANRQ